MLFCLQVIHAGAEQARVHSQTHLWTQRCSETPQNHVAVAKGVPRIFPKAEAAKELPGRNINIRQPGCLLPAAACGVGFRASVPWPQPGGTPGPDASQLS